MYCRVCHSILIKEACCPNCGFDESMAFLHHPTLVRIDGRLYQQKKPEEQPVTVLVRKNRSCRQELYCRTSCDCLPVQFPDRRREPILGPRHEWVGESGSEKRKQHSGTGAGQQQQIGAALSGSAPITGER